MSDLPTPLLTDDAAWQRLDARMLLVHPVRETLKFLPALAAVLVAGAASGRPTWWHFGAFALPAVLGVFRYLTTRYRIAGGRVELQRGLLNRQITHSRLDRVRTVDLTSSPIHRILGLTTVRIGTGATALDADDLDLDGLDQAHARALRAQLLTSSTPPAPSDVVAPAEPGEVEWARFSLSWLRFAPFTGASLGAIGAALGVAVQAISSRIIRIRDLGIDPGTASHLVVAVLLAGLILAVFALSLGAYGVVNGNFLLTHRPGAWHLRRGLLTTRESTIDDDRVAGVRLLRPWPLRLARGAAVQAIVTGLNRKERSSSTLVPPAPVAAATKVAVGVVGHAAATGELRSHGPAATRRRWIRALTPGAVVWVAGVTGWWWDGASWGLAWLPVLATLGLLVSGALAFDRARQLGSAHLDQHLVASSGSLLASRDVLADEHVIGWTLRSTWFQRRAGLVTLTATTAGGHGKVVVCDAPSGHALALAGQVTPGLVSPFQVKAAVSSTPH